jgi:hypothetical protein
MISAAAKVALAVVDHIEEEELAGKVKKTQV